MSYSLSSSFSGHNLLNGFNWFDQNDLSQGSVAYQSKANAEAKGLFSVDENTGVVRLKVDHENQYSPGEGRPSIRLESREQHNHGLFIADFLHMPPSRCGLWPAFWAYGSDWPNGGEIDIIEGVNTMKHTSITAHTKDGCKLQTTPEGIDDAFSGIQAGSDCGRSKKNNIGCGYDPPQHDNSTYGDGFNAVNGGVYAMLWNSKHMKVWHFPRGHIPSDIEAKRPDPKNWKTPMAVFGGSGCDIDSYFKDLRLVINTNFCGDWGNALWGKKDECNMLAPTCAEYVARSPEAFVDAYWDIQYIDTYQLPDDDVVKAQAVKPVAHVRSMTHASNTLGGLSAAGKNLSSPGFSEADLTTRRPADGQPTSTTAFQLEHTAATTNAEASVSQTSTQLAVPTSLSPLDVLVSSGTRILAAPALILSVAAMIAALKW
ncbi:hypothetical protein CDD80_1197 [Ophiocordyceps camponoti-rufipedis]|uniref:GH16 domain-containing protein n=1 Tax=Ophiocordyceps camponoti-rufipedis TaxID=2004952 RepID=A0A2C5XML0_9HYPO|nr:hypothetical protein CDD80_1197 [Ophiocordyceps camponoti-rufipedis]